MVAGRLVWSILGRNSQAVQAVQAIGAKKSEREHLICLLADYASTSLVSRREDCALLPVIVTFCRNFYTRTPYLFTGRLR